MTTTKTTKTAELSGTALNFMVWLRQTGTIYNARSIEIFKDQDKQGYVSYASNWALGGPIIEGECIEVSCLHITGYTPNTWDARHPKRVHTTGPTPLIAAMRCYVAAYLGDTAEIPEEL